MQIPSPRFSSVQFFICEMFGETFYLNSWSFAPCWCPSERHQHDGWKPTETSVTEFCGYQSVNSSVEVLINTKVILLPDRSTVYIAKSTKMSHFFLTCMIALGRHVNNCRVMHIQLVNAVSSVLYRLYHKMENPFKLKI